uniref:Uncharacterized protein n=1 Tax=Rhizophora mucronata TaxID=61149 RepID=A0A2P2N795_RHIMU
MLGSLRWPLMRSWVWICFSSLRLVQEPTSEINWRCFAMVLYEVISFRQLE